MAVHRIFTTHVFEDGSQVTRDTILPGTRPGLSPEHDGGRRPTRPEIRRQVGPNADLIDALWAGRTPVSPKSSIDRGNVNNKHLHGQVELRVSFCLRWSSICQLFQSPEGR